MRGTGRVGLDALARQAGVHPALVRRLFGLGLIEADGGTAAAPQFDPRSAPALRRTVRLRRDLGLNYAGAVLASELLARIEELERQLGDRDSTNAQHQVITWTRIV
jgi:hypothetical protein